MEEVKKIACLGPEGSYSHLATQKLCPTAEVALCRTFAEVAKKLCAGEVDAIALPIENSTQGGIRQNLDLLQENENFYAVKELLLPIDHRLVRKEGVAIADIQKIYSHEQALSQCQRYLYENFPDASYVSTDSTASCLKCLDERSAGIVGAHLAREGLVLSEENIADERTNCTRFLLVRTGKKHLPERSKKVFLCVTLMHRPGTLMKFLQTVDNFGLNLTKLESRPIPSALGEYRFFVEFEGDIGDKIVQYALPELEKGCRAFRLLGAY